MREYMSQKGGSDSPLFSQFLNAIVENISVEADPFFIQRSDAQHVNTISDLHALCVRKDLQHQIRRTNYVAGRALILLHSLGAVSPKRFHSRLLKDPMHLRFCRSQEFSGNVGGVLDRDVEFRV